MMDLEKKKISTEMFGGKKNLSMQEASDSIRADILSGKPFDVIRMGLSELQTISVYTHSTRIPGSWIYGMWVSELFHSEQELQRFVDLYIEAYGSADYMANWYSFKGEENLLKKYAPQATYCSSLVVEPYYLANPWIDALSGKKVLVVNPFTDTIRSQYERRMDIYPNGLLPEFDLRLVQSVWYNTKGGNDRFGSWFDALEYMKSKVAETDFDIALLGCGPFGTPLTSYIKSLGKQAIYIGGAVQILFGIRGSRWDSVPAISQMYNDAWVSPGSDNKPVTTEHLDNDCYW